MTDQPQLKPVDLAALNSAPGWVIDFNRIKRSELEQFNNEITSGEKIIYWMTRVIIRWPFTGDPSKEADYENLGLEDWAEVKARFEERIFRISSKSYTTPSSANGGAPVG
jgi:hypothetical protein